MTSTVTTVWVGKIPPTIDDSDIKALLELCGEIKSWRRVSDPKTNTLKAFGFCDFESPEGAWTAVAALGPAELEPGHTLSLKIDPKTQAQMDLYADQRRGILRAARIHEEQDRRAHLPPGMEDVDSLINEAALSAAADAEFERVRTDAAEAAKSKILAMIPTIKRTAPQPEAAQDPPAPQDPVGSDSVAAPPLPPSPAAATAAAPLPPPVPVQATLGTRAPVVAVGTDGVGLPAEKASVVSKEIMAWKEQTMKRDTEKAVEAARATVSSASASSMSPRDAAADREDRERERERKARDAEREREKLRRERENREFREQERSYEQRERERLKRLFEMDQAARLPPAKRAHRDRERERREDEEDRRREAEDIKAERERAEEEERRKARAEAEERERHAKEEEDAKRRQQEEEIMAIRAHGSYGTFLPPSSDSEIVTQRPPPPSLSFSIGTNGSSPQKSPPRQHQQQAKTAVVPGFDITDTDAGEFSRKKKLTKLEDPVVQPQQQQQQQQQPAPVTPSTSTAAQPEKTAIAALLQHPRPQSAATAAAAKKTAEFHAIADKIPTGKAELFAWQIDWNLVESRGIIEQRMKPWVTKKIVELLGEEDADLLDFVVSLLKEHHPPEKILQQLTLVLDEEAEAFVVRMQRMLIFEVLSCKP